MENRREARKPSHAQQEHVPFFRSKNDSGQVMAGKEDDKPFFSPSIGQAKLKVGAVDDPLEKEADATADRIVQGPSPSNNSHVQRSTEAPAASSEEVQLKEDGLSNEKEPTKGPDLEGRLQNKKGKGASMDDATQSGMEEGFGRDFSGVNVHTDPEAVQMNQALGARAFTNGNDIFFNEGEYNPNSKEGKHLLAHELTHTVQQAGEQQQINKAPLIQRSPLSDELSGIWNTQGKGAFYERLRAVAPVNDADFTTFMNTLVGDDLWLTRNIATYGREAAWPIHLRVEREMKGWGDSGGKGVVFEILRAASGTEAANANLTASLSLVFGAGTEDIWLATNLQQYGPEASWPIHLRVEREMKGWADSGGKGVVFEILRAANGTEAANANLSASLSLVFGAGTDDIWLATNLQQYGPEASWPIHLRVEREMKGWGDSGGKGAVFEILRAANGAEVANVALTTSLNTVFGAGTDDIWLANLLQQYGPEARWPLNKRVERELKGWGDSGGFAAIQTIVAAADETAKKLVLNDAAVLTLLRTRLTGPEVITIVGLLVNLTNVPAGRIRESVAELVISAETLHNNTALQIINGTIIPYYIEDLVIPANTNALVTGWGYDPTVYVVYLAPQDATKFLLQQRNHVGFTNSNAPHYIFGKRSLDLPTWKNLLVHEINHSVNNDEGHAADSFARYKGEFRAYWLAEFSGVADLALRASQIKAHILASYPLLNAKYTTDAAFKALVDAHLTPDGNLTNQ